MLQHFTLFHGMSCSPKYMPAALPSCEIYFNNAAVGDPFVQIADDGTLTLQVIIPVYSFKLSGNASVRLKHTDTISIQSLRSIEVF